MAVKIFGRIGNWLRGGTIQHEIPVGDLDVETNGDAQQTQARRISGGLLRPFRRDQERAEKLEQMVTSVTQLMVTIRDHLDNQNRRQDELIGHMSHLPEVLSEIPNNARMHSDALRAIEEQLKYQNGQQDRLAEILEKINESGVDQREVLDALRSRVEQVGEHHQSISDNLSNFGSAMQSVSRNTESTAQVLQQLRDSLADRDRQIEQMIRKHQKRFATLLGIAIFSSTVAVLLGVYVFLKLRPM